MPKPTTFASNPIFEKIDIWKILFMQRQDKVIASDDKLVARKFPGHRRRPLRPSAMNFKLSELVNI